MIQISLKLPPGLKAAIEKAAKRKFMSAAGYVKNAVARQLELDGIPWTEEKAKPTKKK